MITLQDCVKIWTGLENSANGRTVVTPHEFTRRLTYLSFHGGFGFRMLQHSAVTIESEHGTKPSSLSFLLLYTSSLFLCRRRNDCVILFLFLITLSNVAFQISPRSVDLNYRRPVSSPLEPVLQTLLAHKQTPDLSFMWLVFLFHTRMSRVWTSTTKVAILADVWGILPHSLYKCWGDVAYRLACPLPFHLPFIP